MTKLDIGELLPIGTRIMLAALQTTSFEAKELAELIGVNDNTVRTTLARHRHLFSVETVPTGRRGGQVKIWKAKPEALTIWKEEMKCR